MTEKPENPPAFPRQCSEKDGYPINEQTGATLRDYFAAIALQAYVAKEPHRQGLNAAMAYAQADEMLKVRGQ